MWALLGLLAVSGCGAGKEPRMAEGDAGAEADADADADSDSDVDADSDADMDTDSDTDTDVDTDSDVDADVDADGDADDGSGELFDPDRVPRFELDLPPESVDALWADPRTYVTATLRYGEEVVESIGVRLEGEWNFRDLSGKSAFKLEFDEFVPDQRFRGLRG